MIKNNKLIFFIYCSFILISACTPKLQDQLIEEEPPRESQRSQSIIEEEVESKITDLEEPELEILKGLTATTGKELSQNGEPVVMDPTTTPMYSPEGVRLSMEEIGTYITSGKYVPVPYVDENKNLKLFLLKEASEEQKLRMAEMKRKMNAPNEYIGQKALSFQATNMEGSSVNLSDLKGKVVVLNFWFINCKPCIMEIPELNELVHEYEDKEIIFLAFTPDSKSALEKFRKSTAFDYQIIPETSITIEDYQIRGFPTHVIIDQDGIIQHHETGLSAETINQLRSSINSLLQ